MTRIRFAVRGIFLSVVSVLAMSSQARALPVYFNDPSGLSATAEFTLVNPTTLQIVLTNTSTGLPAGFDGSAQLLTTIAFLLPGTINITGGSAYMTNFGLPGGSTAVGFAAPAGGNVSKEWGYGWDGTGLYCDDSVDPDPDCDSSLRDWSSAMESGTVAFAAGSIAPPPGQDGPDFGLTNGLLPLGSGVEGIDNSVTLTLLLSGALADLGFLNNGVVVEYGSDAAFVPGRVIPEPTTLILFGSGIGVMAARRRLRRRPA